MASQFVWIIGGAGAVGQGIARGLLKAGATVIVNSRYQHRLERMQENLSESSTEGGRLVCVNRSMLPERAEETVRIVLDMTGSRIDHVVAHSGVAWWSGDENADSERVDDESTAYASRGSVLEVPAADFVAASSQLGSMHHTAMQLLLPRLSRGRGSSYTFVTSRESMLAMPRASMAQINAHAVMGLAAAMRQEASSHSWPFARVNELRLGDGMQVNRSQREREQIPRSRPLTHDIGDIVAGMVAASDGAHAGPISVSASTPQELDELRLQYDAAKR